MKVTTMDNSQERDIITAMIVNDKILGRLDHRWKDDLFGSKWANLIAKWCMDYYRKYNSAPNKHIMPIFQRWQEKTKDQNTVKIVERLLSGLSNNWKRARIAQEGSDYTIDSAAEYLNQVALQRSLDATTAMLETGKIQKALDEIKSFEPIDIGSDQTIDVFRDKNAIFEAFNEDIKPLIIYDGDLGRHFGRHLQRDGFIAVMGPEKRGKSFMLMELAITAMMQKRNVLYYDCGDMSKNQVLRRMMSRIAGRPIEAGKVKIPYRITPKKGDGECATVDFKIKKFDRGLSASRSWDACQELIRKHFKDDSTHLRLSCHANSSLSMGTIRADVKSWIKRGWTPDVVVIDYADILAMPSHVKDFRQQIDYNWKSMRALSQEFHVLALTATQTKAAGYTAAKLDMSHFSDDKRKVGQVTGMITLNQSDREAENDVMRLGWIALREGNKLRTSRLVHVAGCRALGNLCVVSSF